MVSLKSLSILGLSIQDNTNLKQLCLTGNIFQGDLYDFSLSLQISSSLRYLNLSKNQLSDLHAEAVCALIKDSCLSTIILDNNFFKSTSFANSINSNIYLEEFSVSYNTLGIDEVLEVLDCLRENKSLKILGVQGYSNILFDKKLAEVLKNSSLVVLRYDLEALDIAVLKEIETTLTKCNRCLVSIEAKGVDWDTITAKHPLLQIKRALKANLWISQNDALPSDCNDDIFIDVQDMVIQKKKNAEDNILENTINEEETIALEYDRAPDIIPVVSEINFKKFIENEHVLLEKKNEIQQKKAENNEKIGKISGKKAEIISKDTERYDFLLKMIEKSEKTATQNIEKIFVSLSKFETRFERIETKLEKFEQNNIKIDDKFESQKDDIENVKIIISSKLNTITDQLETEMSNFANKYKQHSNKIEEKMSQLENKEDRKSTLLKEIVEQYENTQENFKDLELRVDKLEIEKKSPKELDFLNKKAKEIDSLTKESLEIFAKLEEFSSCLKSFNQKFSKLESFEDSTKKALSRLENQSQESERLCADVDKSVSGIEEKINECLRIKVFVNSLQKDLLSKISSLECKVIEVTDNPLIDDLKYTISTYESRINLMEEKISKSLNETVFNIKHRDQLIESRLAFLEQERMNIEELKSKIRAENENFLQKPERSLDERIAVLENLNMSRKGFYKGAKEGYENKHGELSEVLPEEAESIVMGSAIDRANKLREKHAAAKIEKFRFDRKY